VEKSLKYASGLHYFPSRRVTLAALQFLQVSSNHRYSERICYINCLFLH